MKRLILLSIGIFLISSLYSFAQDPDDPGMPDTLIIGSASVVYPVPSNCYIDIPVYFVTDDSIADMIIPITWNSNDNKIIPILVTWHNVFLDWELVEGTVNLNENYIRIVGWSSILEPADEPLLYTDSNRVHGLTITFYVAEDACEQVCLIDTTRIPINVYVYFGLPEASGDIVPIVEPGSIIIGDGLGINDDKESLLPSGFALEQNYPNPFNPKTNIEFQVSTPGFVSVEIFNILGQKTKTLVSEFKEAGQYSVLWDGKDDDNRPVPSGIYFYRMNAGDFSQTKKMVMLK